MNLCTVKWASETKPNPENCKNCLSTCSYDCTASVHNTTQNSSDNLPSYLQTNIIAQMLSVGEEGTMQSKGLLSIEHASVWRAPMWGLNAA